MARTRIPSTVGRTIELIANALEGAGPLGNAVLAEGVASGDVLGEAGAGVAAAAEAVDAAVGDAEGALPDASPHAARTTAIPTTKLLLRIARTIRVGDCGSTVADPRIAAGAKLPTEDGVAVPLEVRG